MRRGLIWLLLFLTASACGRSSESERGASSGRLPYADAPLDSLDDFSPRLDGEVVATEPGSTSTGAAWDELTLRGFPPPGRLSFIRYTNARFGYSIAYPDTLLKPSGPVGEDRGMSFVSSREDVRMMVYAIERDSFEDLSAQYEAAVRDGNGRITYRARDDDFYVVSGRQDGEVFYEKAVSGGGAITTFRMHYPLDDKAYYDAVAALIAASLELRDD